MRAPPSQRVLEFARSKGTGGCQSRACAPPPVGTGGSRRRSRKASDPHTNYMRGLLSKRKSTRADRKADARKVYEIITRYLDQTKTRMPKGTTPMHYAQLDKTRQLAFAASPGLDKRVRIRHTWRMTAEFSNDCHGAHDGKFCGPQGAATPGPDPQGRPLNENQTNMLKRIADRSQHNGATQADAKSLLARGLIERVSGKGQGMGNTPQWKVTEKGRKLLHPEASPDVKATWPKAVQLGPSVRRIVGESPSGKMWLVESQTPGGKPLPVSKESAKIVDE